MTLVEVFGIIAAIFAILGGLWQIAKIVARLGVIMAEVTPNGGSSLKDRVVKLEASQKDQTARLCRIEEKIDRHHGKTRNGNHRAIADET